MFIVFDSSMCWTPLSNAAFTLQRSKASVPYSTVWLPRSAYGQLGISDSGETLIEFYKDLLEGFACELELSVLYPTQTHARRNKGRRTGSDRDSRARILLLNTLPDIHAQIP
jgi:hypothetical protein